MPPSTLGSGKPSLKGKVTAQVQAQASEWTITNDPVKAMIVTMAEWKWRFRTGVPKRDCRGIMGKL